MLVSCSLAAVPYGVCFTLRNNEFAPYWKKNHYDRSTRKYSVSPVDDWCRESFMRAQRVVYIEKF